MSNDARLAVLETTILNINSTLLDIKQDLRRVDDRFDALEKKMDARFEGVDKKFDALESKMDTRFEAIDRKFEGKLDAIESKMDKKFDTLESKMDRKLDALYNRLWSNFLWIMSIIIGLAGLVAHAQHWI